MKRFARLLVSMVLVSSASAGAQDSTQVGDPADTPPPVAGTEFRDAEDNTPASTTTTSSATTSPSTANTAPSNTAPARTATRTPTNRPPSTGEARTPPPVEDEEEEDSYGVVYIRLQGGMSYANLLQFNQENFIPEAEELQGVGGYGGIAFGFRVYWFTFGAAATFARQGEFDLGNVGVEAAFHIPIPVVQPFIRVGLGYAWVGNANYQDPMLSETDIYGLSFEAGAGIDIKLTRVLSIGAGFDAVFLNLTRQSIGDFSVADVMLEEDGDALGFQIRAHGRLTIHI